MNVAPISNNTNQTFYGNRANFFNKSFKKFCTKIIDKIGHSADSVAETKMSITRPLFDFGGKSKKRI